MNEPAPALTTGPWRLPSSAARILALAGVLAQAACVGNLGDGASSGGASSTSSTSSGGPEPHAVAARVRRLSATEALNSIRDVFAIGDLGPIHFPTESTEGAFDNQYDTLTFTDDFAGALQEAAESAGALFATDGLTKRIGCDAATKGEAACLQTFLDVYGLRAHRRPLSTGERSRLVALFTKTRLTEDYPTSIATVVEALIQSPDFAFRTELGATVGAAVPLTRYETAAELSYFLLRSAPDPLLLEAARSGGLETREQITAQARRLLADPRARVAIREILLDWLGMASTAKITKSDAAFSGALARSMLAETSRFLDEAVWNDAAGFSTLLTGSSSYIDENLAPLYGLPVPAKAGLTFTALDPARRAGFLTQPGFIATHTPGLERSPISLGHFFRSKMLCQTPPPPPPGVPPLPMDPTLDVHARFLQHEKDPSCSGCHSQMDPIGFGFDQFDVLGRFQPKDHSVVEDGKGQLTNTDIDGGFNGPVELAHKLSGSKQVKTCFTGTFLQFALGRPVTTLPVDATAVQAASDGKFAAGGDLKELVVALVTTDAFLLRDTTALPTGGN